MPVNELEGILFPQATVADDRKNVASTMRREMDQKIPVLLDTMDDATNHAYAALPNRYYLIDEAGESGSGRGLVRAAPIPTASKRRLSGCGASESMREQAMASSVTRGA